MEDNAIIELYWQRSEAAIAETSTKYGNYLHSISYNILANAEDAEECVNDTYNAAWHSMPPNRPSVLSVFLGSIARRISIDLWRKHNALRRGGGETALALDELEECIAVNTYVEQEIERRELNRVINDFLKALPGTERQVFMCRYWYMDSVSSISEQFGFSESKVKSMLFRTRKRLRTVLEKEGY